MLLVGKDGWSSQGSDDKADGLVGHFTEDLFQLMPEMEHNRVSAAKKGKFCFKIAILPNCYINRRPEPNDWLLF